MAEPAVLDASEDRVFEIGLVMAGAISAGAYTAGVADFLIEALDEWYAFNKRRGGNSLHEVKIRVISGASAGGMTGSILTAAFGADFPPVKNRPEEKSRNPLYSAWVQQIDIEHLLKSQDIEALRTRGAVKTQRKIRKLRSKLAKGKLSQEAFDEEVAALKPDTIFSILDSTKLAEIAEKAVDVAPNTSAALSERRPYLPNPFQLYLSISNLRGVPYVLPLKGDDAVCERMITHADFMHFALTPDRPKKETFDASGNQYVEWADPHNAGNNFMYAFWLDPTVYKTKNWEMLAKAALATGAFPFGLAPVKLDRIWGHYKTRTFPVNKFENGRYVPAFQNLLPESNESFKDTDPYPFTSVDGGLLDNAPFDLAHRALVETRGSGNEQDARFSDRAIILIAPFPDSKATEDYKHPTGPLALAGAIADSLMKQVRFNPEELILASDPNVGSRYLISPTRGDAEPKLKHGNIACGTLGGFGGFLSEQFRYHDFMLGRRNCQRFLQQYFVLPEKNPLFVHWAGMDEAEKSDFYVGPPPGAKLAGKYLPILPLAGSAKEPINIEKWPAYSEKELDKLLERVAARYTSVGNLVIDLYADGFFFKRLLRFGLWSQKSKIMRSIRGSVKKSLIEYGIPWAPEEETTNLRLWLLLGLLALCAASAAFFALS
jgi:hypothetical protein